MNNSGPFHLEVPCLVSIPTSLIIDEAVESGRLGNSHTMNALRGSHLLMDLDTVLVLNKTLNQVEKNFYHLILAVVPVDSILPEDIIGLAVTVLDDQVS